MNEAANWGGSAISFLLFVKLLQKHLHPWRQMRFHFEQHLQVMRNLLDEDEAEHHIGSVMVISHGRGL
jgi:hypothetical protein